MSELRCILKRTVVLQFLASIRARFRNGDCILMEFSEIYILLTSFNAYVCVCVCHSVCFFLTQTQKLRAYWRVNRCDTWRDCKSQSRHFQFRELDVRKERDGLLTSRFGIDGSRSRYTLVDCATPSKLDVCRTPKPLEGAYPSCHV